MKTKNEHSASFRLATQRGEPMASIDLGTNTFHLLIVEQPTIKTNQFKIIHKEKIAVTIGQGGINKGIINKAAQARMFEALRQFRRTLDHYCVKPNATYVTATSALRNAKNKQRILKKIKEEVNFDVNVISGTEEATYIYYGVKTVLQLDEKPYLIMDIGGGSVEFVIADKQQVFWKESFEIGAQRLLELFMTNDPITTEEVEKLYNYIKEKLVPLTQMVKKYAPQVLIGSSGTFDTLHEIDLQKQQIDRLNHPEEARFSRDAFLAIFKDFLHKDRTQRLAIPGMTAMRVDMIVVASCLLDFILETYQINEVKVSPYALKEGVLSYQLGWV